MNADRSQLKLLGFSSLLLGESKFSFKTFQKEKWEGERERERFGWLEIGRGFRGNFKLFPSLFFFKMVKISSFRVSKRALLKICISVFDSSCIRRF